MAKRLVSISSIGAVIRKKQKELRGAKKGRSKAEQEKLDAKIKALDKHYTAVKTLCTGGWKL
ncbi:MAG TPA: hypothetical protein VGQ11_10915 [Candidatus Acidoferrales bacterium]|jgi:hypothetical protein|nr:hypothetical protein [Candidatus Acidoferrales bacterium]